MKSLLEYITEDTPKRDKDIPKTDKDTNKEDIPKIDKDTPKRDIINNENKVNENKVDDFKRAVSSIGFRKIKVYRF